MSNRFFYLPTQSSLKNHCINIRTTAITATLVFASMAMPNVSAQETVTLPPTSITATRVAQTANESITPVTVISRKMIETSQAYSLQDLLQRQAGLTVTNQGGAGKLSSLFLRGTESDHVIVLLDGVRLGDATTGANKFQDIPLAWIERIEIVRGPLSSLYGPEAIGGVIQIFTKRNYKKFSPSFSVTVGSNNTRKSTLSLAGNINEQGWFKFGLANETTDGINARRNINDPAVFFSPVFEPDKDNYSNKSYQLQAGWRFNDKVQADINVARAYGETQFDGGFQNESKVVVQSASANLKFAPSSIWDSTLLIGQSKDLSKNFLNGVPRGEFNTERDMFTWQNDIAISKHHQIIAGFDWYNDRVISNNIYKEDSRRNQGAFIQYLGDFDGHSLQASFRGDDNQQFNAVTTGSIGVGFDVGNDIKLLASYGTAFKAPTFNDLYFPDFFGFVTSNATLRPEKSSSRNIGIKQNLQQLNWSINAYSTSIRDLIVFGNIPENVDRARIRGIEAAVGFEFNNWRLNANLNNTVTKNLSTGDNYGKPLARRPKHTASLSVDKTVSAWNYGFDFHGESFRYDDAASSANKKTGGFGKADVRMDYKINSDWRILAKINNVTDRVYETVYSYNQPRREYYLTIRFEQ